MPLLLYFPLIIWMGMVEIVQGENPRQNKSTDPAATPVKRVTR